MINLKVLLDNLSKRSAPKKVADNVTVNGGSSFDAVVQAPDGYSAAAVTVRVTYQSGASISPTLYWLYSPDGQNFDDETSAANVGNSQKITLSAGNTVQMTVLAPIFTPYMKLVIENGDTEAITLDMWVVWLR